MIKDVEPLLKECEETLAELMRMGNMEVACYVQGFINSINKLPDAEQRPHGEWIPVDEIGNVVRCSQCSFRTCADVAEEEYNFCPNCGAKMQKERR